MVCYFGNFYITFTADFCGRGEKEDFNAGIYSKT